MPPPAPAAVPPAGGGTEGGRKGGTRRRPRPSPSLTPFLWRLHVMEHSRNGPTSHPLQGTVTAAQRAHALSHTHPGAVPGVPAHTRTSPVSGTPAGTRWQPGHVRYLRRAGWPRVPPLPRCPPIRSRGAGGRAECPVGSAPPRAPLPGGDHAHSPPQEGITQGSLLLICIHLQAGYSPHFLTACHRQRPVPAVSPSCAGSEGRAAGRGAPGTVPVPASARSRRHRGDLPVRRFYSPAGFPRRRPPATLPSIYPRSPGRHSERRHGPPRSCLPRPDPSPAAPRTRAPPLRRGCQLVPVTGNERRAGRRGLPAAAGAAHLGNHRGGRREALPVPLLLLLPLLIPPGARVAPLLRARPE